VTQRRHATFTVNLAGEEWVVEHQDGSTIRGWDAIFDYLAERGWEIISAVPTVWEHRHQDR